MKVRKISGVMLGMLITGSVLVACKEEFLDQQPIGALTENVLKTEAGIKGLLIAAYSLLDGTGSVTNNWEAAGSNFVFGSIASDEAHKGSDPSDQVPMLIIERYETLPSTGYLNQKWRTLYDGIARANDVLRLMKDVPNMTDQAKARVAAEARFLRAHYHFDARKIFEKVPYVDEMTVNINDINTAKVANDKEVWPMIEADFQFAIDNLPETQSEVGRANKSAAKAYLAKVYMYQEKFAEALPLLNEVIASGKTPIGAPYALVNDFSRIYEIANKNNEEVVFGYQSSVNDGSAAVNANSSEVLNFPNGGGAPGGCCGFFQPTQNLVNSYKVDANGLPLLDTFNESDLKNDDGIKTADPFTPDRTTPVDPRLDFTVGRRGVPYYDWGLHPGSLWIRNQTQMGPYSPKKKVYRKSDVGQYTDGSSWTPGYNAQVHAIIRFADVLLMAAEAEAEVGSLARATELVNRVRARAANESAFVKLDNGQLAANYKIGQYPTFASQDFALKAIRFERKLELAMEGDRFFDLVRWGIAAPTLNKYLDETERPYLQGARFTEGQDEYYPIPEQQIVLSQVNGVSVLQPNRNK
ncbi:RagB/SusD family nutrient uptake outer membrane protein [Pontibacter sp. E15-1]|uniref:RagB/SusD family nutrient uptake outer membrane protein n=1 Tax=Pontibacter sp. E15-1 TaxID=2919918 RepID=UPI001F4F55ED|nr:RagB/SusD family nutrient uptake outer membrane protein [Pontibacter sp. E15-1]MCJ8164035.1 RagB/SusD family nutrient uptake outer membrane protein [Pontibacter sp. E15-1]